MSKTFQRLKKRDSYLFDINIHEDALSNRLAGYLRDELESELISVDTEYNRHGDQLKKYGLEGRSAVVDIVVHSRGNDDLNLFAIESKKINASQDDYNKINALVDHEFNYRFGVVLEYFSGRAEIFRRNENGLIVSEEIRL
ncbi:hypothetical protein [Algoriphagus formosus]|uniref:hypothetical protein n=1 Tax=Algoriphagus formosus TaxID=2007308 RepID=UPI0018E22CE6|nr:hypothetical protein [Algoriphagus formosus]